jgi:uncharacterized protein YggE
MIHKLSVLLLTATLFTATARGQSGSTNDPYNSEITVSSEASVSAKPDIADFNLSIIVRELKATDSFKSYLRIYNSLMNSLSSIIDTTKLLTHNLSITPSFDYKQPGKIMPDYYQVSALMDLTVPLTLLNETLSRITSVEGVTINGIRFNVRNQDSLQTVALEEAIKKADQKAELIARLENLRGLKVKSMNTSISRPPVPLFSTHAETVAISPSVNASDVTVSASITVTYTTK